MKRTGFVYDNRFLQHLTYKEHPESHYRLLAICKRLIDTGLLAKLTQVPVEPANQRWIEAVHNIKYIMRFEEACIMGFPDIDHQDNSICRETYSTAFLAVGGVLRAIDEIMAGNIDNAFAAVRPPGHHAEVNRAMGFCYFNNVAIAARYLQRHHGMERVAIVDFDVHHGNGTQHIFEADPTVFYYSIHEHPSFAYPGTGREFETGIGDGAGATLNSPAFPGQGDEEYRHLIERDMIPAIRDFAPDFILASAGFDAHVNDLMSGINLTGAGFDFVTQEILALAETHCHGRLVSVLEGGYDLETMPTLVENHIRLMAQLDRP